MVSDVHLGTYGCHAKELNQYLKSINPKVLVLNGDIIDIWNFRKRYFPKDHIKVLRSLLRMAQTGTTVHYITGNHDEVLRRFNNFSMGNVHIKNHLELSLDGRSAWIFHGDVFDVSIQQAKFIAKLGGWGYDLLIVVNRWVNEALEKLGREKYSLSKRIKESVKKAVKFIDDFEKTASDLAIAQGYEFVVCGHIHQPQIKVVETAKGTTTYLNSGDWVESLSALEYQDGKWELYMHPLSDKRTIEAHLDDEYSDMTTEELLNELVSGGLWKQDKTQK